MKYKDFYITYTKDCCENKGGYFCQVYTDSMLDNEIDNFCIHENELVNNSIKDIIKLYINQYDKELNKKRVLEVIEKVEQEFINELDYDYESDYKDNIDGQDLLMFNELIERFTRKLYLMLDDEMNLEN